MSCLLEIRIHINIHRNFSLIFLPYHFLLYFYFLCCVSLALMAMVNEKRVSYFWHNFSSCHMICWHVREGDNLLLFYVCCFYCLFVSFKHDNDPEFLWTRNMKCLLLLPKPFDYYVCWQMYFEIAFGFDFFTF